VPLTDVGAGANEDCAGCRKRKEHEEDFIENECKFSKQSPDEDSVSFLMRKWSSNCSGDESRSNEGLSPILDKKSSETSPVGSFSWMQRHRNDSFKENETVEENNNSEEREAIVVKGRFMISDSDSLSLSEKHRATVPVKQSGRKSKTKQLSKKLSALQTKIETESEVIQMKIGYRPSHADKMKVEEISDLMQEKEKIRLELKDLTEETPRKKSVEKVLEKERDRIIQNLKALRLSVGRPYELEDMTADQIADERQDMKTLLNEFEKKYSVPLLTKRDKETMSGLYERYRCVRRLCRRQSSDLVPIPEEASIDLTLASPRQRISSVSLSPEPPYDDTEDDVTSVTGVNTANRLRVSRSVCVSDEKWHQMTFRELSDTLGQLKESKKVYKRKINEVESGTTNNDVEDDDIYVLYKATKYKIKLIKALIEKQNKNDTG